MQTGNHQILTLDGTSPGSGGTETGHFYAPDGTAQTTNIFLVSSEAAITVTNSSGNLYYANVGNVGVNVGDGTGIISNLFPKGYNAFYCMKYEVTQGQYADFLNKLTTAQATNRYSSASTGSRYTIGTNTLGQYTNGAPDRACNMLSWVDGLAYADWAGLRPMTELEYEKACRGPATPVAGEYAWGNATVLTNLDATGCIGTDGSGTETPSPATANCLVSTGLQGPTRVGIFATTISDRVAAGASYWGIMEMSGNVWERPVSVGTVAARRFTGLHGNGKLATDGTADVSNWPTEGTLLRGGGWVNTSPGARVSDRNIATYNGGGAVTGYGWRGVRTAP